MVRSGILEYCRPLDALKNKTLGSGIEVNPYEQKHVLYVLKRGKGEIDDLSGQGQLRKFILHAFNQIIVIVNLDIENERHRIRNITDDS